MSRVCEICGRGPQVGHNVSHAHNLTKRRWEINLQNMRVVIDGQTKRIKVCTRCIQAGKIVRPAFQPRKRKPKEAIPSLKEVRVALETVEEEPVSEFFSEASIVDTIFKKKKRPGETAESETDSDDSEKSVDTDAGETADSTAAPIIVEVEQVPDNELFPPEKSDSEE